MKLNRISYLSALALASTLALSACGKKEEAAEPPAAATPPPATASMAPVAVSIDSIDLGSAVGADQKITSATTSFTPKDPIYAAVSTNGTGNATLAAKWTYQDGQTVKEDSKSISASGPETTSFQISKPDGWPVGSYKVEISLNGQPAGSKDFSVK
ncbi:hypothetical protein [Dyella sp. 20L07]|uniref:hypothetical protein n=1 Tax=Dyella sp. 20L07 TaxID=3384240 RepID=UPI003D2E75CA